MKNTLCILVAWAAFFGSLSAQNIVKTLTPTPSDTEWELAQPFGSPRPFFTAAVQFFSEKPLHLRYATAKGDRLFSEWQEWEEDPHLRDGAPANRHTTSLLFLDSEVRFLKVALDPSAGHAGLLGNLQVHFFNPGEGTAPGGLADPTADERDNCTCPLPEHRKREQWCTTGDCPPAPNPSLTTVTHLIVHHSAGVSSSSNWNAVVTSIWNFHVNTNGWADIGYNWLIAPDGTVFQGRGDNVVGAHFCGANAGTMGVCMLGTYTNTTVSPAAAGSLAKLLAWKCCVRGLDPLGTAMHGSSGLNLKRISGHRDGCATECPGNAFYPDLPKVRDSVAQVLAACSPTSGTGAVAAPEAGVEVFPNPVSRNSLSVRLPFVPLEAVRFSMFDPLGRAVFAQWLPAAALVEPHWDASLPAGAYIWVCTVGQRVFSGKILLTE